MNYDYNRPGSRVSKPPGGASSNIFGEATQAVKPSGRMNPSFHSTIFGVDKSEPAATKTNPDDEGATELIKPKASYSRGTGLENSSTLFSNLQYAYDPRFEPGVRRRPNTAQRRDPITGKVMIEEKVHEGEGEKKDLEEEKENVEIAQDEATSAKSLEPHLGPVKNTSGTRCNQPPGGKSSFTFG